MRISPAFDGSGFVFLFLGFGLLVATFAFLIAIMAEAVIFRLLKWNSFGKSFLASCLVNIASTAAGYILAIWLGWEGVGGLIDRFLLFFAGAFTLTIFIESVLLVLLDRAKWRRGLLASIAANIVSHIWNGWLLWKLSLLYKRVVVSVIAPDSVDPILGSRWVRDPSHRRSRTGLEREIWIH